MADADNPGGAEEEKQQAGEALGTGLGLPLGAEKAQSEQQRPKIDVLLKAVGNTPIMKQKKWSVEHSRTVQGLGQFVKRFLKFEPSEQLFIYVNQSFAPCPEHDVGTLYECFGSDRKLVLHYCKTQAWG